MGGYILVCPCYLSTSVNFACFIVETQHVWGTEQKKVGAFTVKAQNDGHNAYFYK